MKAQSITVVVEGVAGAVVTVVASLVNMRVDVAVQDGNCQVVPDTCAVGRGQEVVVANPVTHTKKLIYPLRYFLLFQAQSHFKQAASV